MKLRLYKPEDEAAVREIFAKQKIAADLPLPWHDPAVAVALVGEDEDGRILLAIIGRLTVEAHLAIAPEEPHAATLIHKAMLHTEGAMLAIADAMREKKCATVTDVIAYVPKEMERMHDMMNHLGFVKEPETFVPYWKSLGKVA